MNDLKTRFIGNCPVCEGDFKLHEGKLVHHGYRRPGIGSIVGDCFAVGMEPYEVSDEGCKLYKLALLPDLKAHQAELAKLNAGEYETLKYRKWDYTAANFVEIPAAKGTKEYDKALRSSIIQMEQIISEIERHIARMDSRIAEWTAKPIRTVEEEASAVKAVKDAKRAEKQAERDAKVQAKIESIQKRLDSAMRTKNANSIANIFTGLDHKAYELNMNVVELIVRINRGNVWEFFGLTLPTIVGTWQMRQADPCHAANRDILRKMTAWVEKPKDRYWPTGK